MSRVTIAVFAMFFLVACSNGDVGSTVESEPAVTTVKPQGPVHIDYRIIGTPIVGQPVAIELQVRSALNPQAISLSYRIDDATAMQFPEAQPPRVSLAAINDQGPTLQQVSVIPLREGRLFLNVAAQIEAESGTISTVTVIPIQVGSARVREPQEHGVVTTDESGEAIRVLKGEG